MKKITWLLVSLLLGQPLFVWLFRHYLLPTVPIHYGFWFVAWNSFPANNLTVALMTSTVVPIILLATQPFSFNELIPIFYSWHMPLKICWFWWLLGLNWLILISLFFNATWCNMILFLWTLIWIGQILVSLVASTW